MLCRVEFVGCVQFCHPYLPPMILFPHPVLPNRSSQKSFVSSPPFIGWTPSSSLWYLNNHTNSSTIPSSVLGPPPPPTHTHTHTNIYIYIYIFFFFFSKFYCRLFFSIKIKQSLKVISISLISKLYNFLFLEFLIDIILF